MLFWGESVLLKVFAVKYLQRLCGLFWYHAERLQTGQSNTNNVSWEYISCKWKSRCVKFSSRCSLWSDSLTAHSVICSAPLNGPFSISSVEVLLIEAIDPKTSCLDWLLGGIAGIMGICVRVCVCVCVCERERERDRDRERERESRGRQSGY